MGKEIGDFTFSKLGALGASQKITKVGHMVRAYGKQLESSYGDGAAKKSVRADIADQEDFFRERIGDMVEVVDAVRANVMSHITSILGMSSEWINDYKAVGERQMEYLKSRKENFMDQIITYRERSADAARKMITMLDKADRRLAEAKSSVASLKRAKHSDVIQIGNKINRAASELSSVHKLKNSTNDKLDARALRSKWDRRNEYAAKAEAAERARAAKRKKKD